MPSSVLFCRETCLQTAFSDCTFLATFLATCEPAACNERSCHQSSSAPQHQIPYLNENACSYPRQDARHSRLPQRHSAP